MSDKRRSERTHREAINLIEGFWTLARWSGGWVCPPHSMERRRRTDTAGRALARYPARRMAGSNSTSIRRHCSQPVASAVDLHFGFLDFNGSLLPSQRLKWEEVSRLAAAPPPIRSNGFPREIKNDGGSVRRGGGCEGARARAPERSTTESNRDAKVKATARAERARSGVGAKIGSSSVVDTHQKGTAYNFSYSVNYNYSKCSC